MQSHQPILNANGQVVDQEGSPIDLNDPLQFLAYFERVALEFICDEIDALEKEYAPDFDEESGD